MEFKINSIEQSKIMSSYWDVEVSAMILTTDLGHVTFQIHKENSFPQSSIAKIPNDSFWAVGTLVEMAEFAFKTLKEHFSELATAAKEDEEYEAQQERGDIPRYDDYTDMVNDNLCN
jgi:hypothetical protein